MKQAEVIIGIIFIVTGAILFAINWGIIIKLFGFVLLSAGVIIYVVAVDSLDEKKEIKKKNIVLRILPLK
jgi:energy-converting hydrogenase Eha subunit C